MAGTNVPVINLTGQQFTYLYVVGECIRTKKHVRHWACICKCGKIQKVMQGHLISGHTKSCGCYQKENRPPCKKRLPEYKVWKGLRTRCHNPREPSWQRYGGRGIQCCRRWDSFENFYADMGPRPTPKHTLERKDNDKGYEPDNCVWATYIEQQNNRSSNRHLTHNGRTMTLMQWSREVGLDHRTIGFRLKKGWDIERALYAPLLNRH